MKTIVLTENNALQKAIQDGEEDVLLVRDGHVVALVTPYDDEDAEWYLRERDPVFIASLGEARRQVEQGKTISHEELMSKLELDKPSPET